MRGWTATYAAAYDSAALQCGEAAEQRLNRIMAWLPAARGSTLVDEIDSKTGIGSPARPGDPINWRKDARRKLFGHPSQKAPSSASIILFDVS
jgi:hypothetical protein